ncbi:MAG: hypothetical protein HRT35_08055 [Algicola sp.]|nr:hypothetical protein [Algicola sp.]
MIHKIASSLLVILAIICALLSAAPFTPAVFVSLVLMIIAGIYGFYRHFVTATVLLCFGSLAVILSPVMTAQSGLIWLVLVAYVVGLAGVVWGLWKAKS